MLHNLAIYIPNLSKIIWHDGNDKSYIDESYIDGVFNNYFNTILPKKEFN